MNPESCVFHIFLCIFHPGGKPKINPTHIPSSNGCGTFGIQVRILTFSFKVLIECGNQVPLKVVKLQKMYTSTTFTSFPPDTIEYDFNFHSRDKICLKLRM